jgi:hypothetical protein
MTRADAAAGDAGCWATTKPSTVTSTPRIAYRRDLRRSMTDTNRRG